MTRSLYSMLLANTIATGGSAVCPASTILIGRLQDNCRRPRRYLAMETLFNPVPEEAVA